jgi:hypothetical protein
MLALLHRSCQLLLVIAKQDMNFTMRFLADGVKSSDFYRATPESCRGVPQAEP